MPIIRYFLLALIFKTCTMRAKYTMPAIIGLLLFWLTPMAVKAQSFTSIKKVLNGALNEIVTNAEITVQDSAFFNATLIGKLEGQYPLKNAVTLKINEYSNVYINAPYTVTADLLISYIGGDSTLRSVTKQLQIKYDTGKAYTNNAAFVFSRAHRVTVKVQSVTASLPRALKTVLLENEIQVRPVYKLNRTTDAVQNIQLTPLSLPESDEATTTWNAVLGADEYDVEWAYIDSSVIASGRYGSPLNYEKIFNNNATRVTVAGNSYSIPLLYDNGGFLYVRVRAVSLKADNTRFETQWSNAIGNVAIMSYRGHQRNLNWQSFINYAEDGKRKAVVKYFDGGLLNRQTVTKDNTTNTTIVAETLYDRQGRPAIQVLPAPTLSNIIQYTFRFNTDINGNEYDKSLYDTVVAVRDIIDAAAPAMGTTSGAAQYYSPQSPFVTDSIHSNVPNAGGYPFTETVYTNDNTGRISRQGNVGPAFRTNGTHTTKYYYGSPSQEELDRLFGTEAGDASHYFKNMLQDANGQLSVIYTDMHGRTVATALAGTDENSQLKSLPSNKPATVLDTLSGLSNTQIQHYSLLTRRSLLVESDTRYTFKYAITPPTLKIRDCNNNEIDYTAKYNLEIRITDDVNNLLLPDNQPFVKRYTITGPLTDTFSIFLPRGNYEVTKTLVINEAEMERYRDSIYLPGSVCINLDSITRQQRTIMNSPNCAPDCSTCKTEIGSIATFTVAYMNRAGLNVSDSAAYRTEIATAYTQQIDYCNKLCNTVPQGDNLKAAMLQDMTPPGGQYANTDTTDKYSIFFELGSQTEALFRNPAIVYLNEEGKPDLVYDEDMERMVLPQQLSPDQFTNKFKASWAQQLLPYHPEYCRYVESRKFDDSKRWEDEIRAVDTYQEALLKGYLNPTANSSYSAAYGMPVGANKDPFVNMGSNTALVNTFLSSYIKQGSTSYNIWVVAAATTLCSQSICLSTYQGESNIFSKSGLCTGDKDAIWRTFRELYLQRRDSLMNAAIRNISCSPTPTQLLTKGKFSHFAAVQDHLTRNGLSGINIGSTQSSVQHFADSAGASFKNDACNSYVDTWMKQLTGCNYTPYWTEIKARLLAVCKAGTDTDHPMGASSVPYNSSLSDSSFEDVLTKFKVAHPELNVPAGCPTLLTIPAPYYAQQQGVTRRTTTPPTPCECTKIKEIKFSYDLAKLSGESFSQYLLRTQHLRMTEQQLNDLLSACSGQSACVYTERELVIPPAFQCYTAPPCARCAVVKAVSDSFKYTYPGILPDSIGVDSLQQIYNQVYANYMNSRLGFSFRSGDYLQFLNNCSTAVFIDSIITEPNYTRSTFNYGSGLTIRDARPTGDGGYVFVGSVNNSSGVAIPFISKVDRNSNPVFQKTVASKGMTSGFFYRVMVASDGNIVACGVNLGSEFSGNAITVDSLPALKGAGTMVKFNASGVVQWGQGFNSDQVELIRQVIELQNGDYGFMGDWSYPGDVTPAQWMVGVMSNGGILKWRKRIKNMPNHCLSIRLLEDNDTLILAGILVKPPEVLFQPHLLRWNKTTGAFLPSFYIHTSFKADMNQFDKLADGTYRISAILSQSNGATRGPITIIDVSGYGVIQRQKTLTGLEGFNFGWLAASQQTDGSIFFGLQMESGPGPVYLMKYNSGNTGAFSWSKKLTGIYGFTRWTGPIGSKIVSLGSSGSAAEIYTFNNSAAADCETTVTAPTASTPSYASYTFAVDTANIVNLLGVGLYGRLDLKDSSISVSTSYYSCSTGTGNITNVHYYTGPWLCGQSQPTFESTAIDTVNNCFDSTFFIVNTATEIYKAKIDSASVDFISKYLQTALNAATNEQFTVAHKKSEYHYTLYYYDQAGNLTKTIPPAGVVLDTTATWLQDVRAARASGTHLTPPHNFITSYRYNSLNKVTDQVSPDGGQSHFFYDRIGRLVISRNEKQGRSAMYSYTTYDTLGRVHEVGEITSTFGFFDYITRDPATLEMFLSYFASTRTQIVQTNYDQPYYGYLGSPSPLVQRNLRNRVSWVSYFNNAVDMDTYTRSTAYSYDTHGNVDTLLQDFRSGAMNSSFNRFKKIAYNYDLISGKVNKVSYQPGNIDAFYHRYRYDAENRITDVETSSDDFHWEKDAFYQYYKHGPLARSVIGQQQIQGIDYAYTLQGWLKGVNGGSPATATDMGHDGKSGGYSAQDAFGFSLHYYGDSDYIAIGTADKLAKGTASNTTLFKPLFNGNIAAMGVNLPKFGSPLLYTYQYDVLNRLSAKRAANGFNTTTNTWTPVATEDLKEELSYDANGNITAYRRNGNTAVAGNPLVMDNLTYEYYPGKNQLNHVEDSVGNSNYSADLDNQPSQNYVYDSIGNLVYDEAAGIDSIRWSVYGKISRIKKNNGTVITYAYDAMGNRVSKEVGGIGTYYVRDASGNIMSIYTAGDLSVNSGDMTQVETSLYGSSRLGVLNQRINVKNRVLPDTVSLTGAGYGIISIFNRGNKVFELSNHLGNVLTTLSDRKRPISTNDSLIDRYEPVVLSAHDYYAFGMLIPGRNGSLDTGGNWVVNGGGYRYGVNGQEKSNEIKGEGNSYTAMFWEYDPRIGRRWNVDPKPNVSISQYVAFSNRPIQYNDPQGDTIAPLTTFELQRIARPLAGDRQGVRFNKFVGRVFEGLALESQGALTKNGVKYSSIERFQKTGGNVKDVIPDGISAVTYKRLDIAYLQMSTVVLPNSHFYEVKAVDGTINLSYSNYQIQGELDAIKKTPGYSEKRALFTFVTTANTKIGLDVVNYATKNGIQLFQVTANYETDNDRIYFSYPRMLNYGVWPKGNFKPLPFTFHPAWETPQIPNDPDPNDADVK